MQPRVRGGLAALLLAGAALAAYHNSFRVPFLFDDEGSILDNPSIRHLWPLTIPLSPPRNFGFTVSGRPILNLSLAVNHALGGTLPWGYHAGNLAIHFLAGLTLFALAARTCRSPVLASAVRGREFLVALGFSLLWLLHPLQTEAVTYIVQRAESLMGLFFLLTLYTFERSTEAGQPARRWWQGASVACCLAGAGCKEVMITAPIIVLLYDRTFVAGDFRSAWRERRGYYIAAFATWLPLFALVAATGGDRGGTFRLSAAGLGQYWLGQGWALLHYMKLAVWPQPLIFEYGTLPPASVVAEIFASLTVLAVAAAAIWALRRRPVTGFFAAWFFIILAPSSLLPGLTQQVVEHRMYIPLIAVLALGCGAIMRWPGPWPLRVIFALAAGAGILTERRNRDYASDLALWTDTVAKRPQSAKAQSNLGTALLQRGRLDEGMAHYRESLKLDPGSAQTHYDLGLVLARMDRHSEAVPEYIEAVRILPYLTSAQVNLGAELVLAQQPAAALEHLRVAVAYRPDLPEAQYTLALALAATGRWDEAIARDREALRLRPDFAEAESALGAALLSAGQPEAAGGHLRRALQLQPALAEAHFNAGIYAETQGDFRNALAEYTEAVRLRPGATGAEARVNLGIALARNGQTDLALGELREAARLQPALAAAHANLGIVLAEVGDPTSAIVSYERALALRPVYPSVEYNLGNAFVMLRRWREARIHFAAAIREQPGFTAAIEMLERLTGAPDGP